MGVDFPDFQQTSLTNIILQDLAEVINRPKYGQAQRITDSVTATPLEWVPIFTLSSKGVTYGGWLSIYHPVASPLSIIRFTIDEQVLLEETFYKLFNYSVAVPFDQPMYIKKYDEQIAWYVASFSYGITFESSILVEFYNKGAESDLDYVLFYALV